MVLLVFILRTLFYCVLNTGYISHQISEYAIVCIQTTSKFLKKFTGWKGRVSVFCQHNSVLLHSVTSSTKLPNRADPVGRMRSSIYK